MKESNKGKNIVIVLLILTVAILLGVIIYMYMSREDVNHNLDYNDNNTPNNYRDDLIYISNPGRNDNAVTSGWLNVNSMGCVSISYFVY